MASKATQRLVKELEEVKASPVEGIRINVTDNLFVWEVQVAGPAGTPYSGGKFNFVFTFTMSYPIVPPKVKCITKCFHCNFNGLGDVCLNIVKDDWSPLMTVSGVAVGLQQLLAEPNPYSPLNPETGKLYIENLKEYTRKARLYTKKYAM